MTSNKALQEVKFVFKAAKAGHTGSLDPLATGLLPLAFGEATKTVSYIMEGSKTYEFSVCWGEERSTDDAEGEVTATSDLRPTKDEIIAVLDRFTGDIEQQIERWLVAEGLVAPAAMLKLPHHGSRTSTSEALLEAAKPSFALVSAGFQNSYGFPHPDVLKRLERTGTTLLRTDLQGLVTLRSDGRRFEVDTKGWSPPWFARRAGFETAGW